jgi:hypothetical protein
VSSCREHRAALCDLVDGRPQGTRLASTIPWRCCSAISRLAAKSPRVSSAQTQPLAGSQPSFALCLVKHARMTASRMGFRHVELPHLAYSVEKISTRVRRKNRSAVEGQQFPLFEGPVALHDLRPQSFSVGRTSCFLYIFGCISIKRKNLLCTERELFNRIGRLPPDADRTGVHRQVATPKRSMVSVGFSAG